MSPIQLDISFGRKERDAGIQNAIDHANAVNPEWSEIAYTMFKTWLSKWVKGYKFTIEEFRQVAQIMGLPDPPNNRSFGHIAVRARKEGLIISNGTVKVKNPKAHCANANQWQKV